MCSFELSGWSRYMTDVGGGLPSQRRSIEEQQREQAADRNRHVDDADREPSGIPPSSGTRSRGTSWMP